MGGGDSCIVVCIAFYGDMKSKTRMEQNTVVWLFVQSTQEPDCLSIPSAVWSLHKGCLEMAHPAVQLVSCTRQSIRRKDQQEKVYLNKVLASLQRLCLILCCCRCRLLPLHHGRDMVLERPGPQQLHLPLGHSSGTKGKTCRPNMLHSQQQTRQIDCFIASDKWLWAYCLSPNDKA